MVIYIEYALFENFLFDSVLLFLALKAAKENVRPFKVGLAAVMGAVFAVVFPLLRLSVFGALVLKTSVGFLLCLIAFGNIKTKKDRGRYALTTFFFFTFTFLFGGVLLGVTQDFFKNKVPSVFVMTAFAILTVLTSVFIQKLYQKRRLQRFIYPCTVFYGENIIKVDAFLDSGNRAQKNGLPVCFLSLDTLYELRKEEIWHKGEGQVCDEIEIHTLGGVKKLPIYQGEIVLKKSVGEERKKVYLAPATNMVCREYSMILSAYVLEETGEK
ncbi:MAG: sigma-E processing peptidase SpoIIGA [Clostridia bacterium]|nr:sigma-E processing peptidase SpoIIGA [Clostridia bacterium]